MNNEVLFFGLTYGFLLSLVSLALSLNYISDDLPNLWLISLMGSGYLLMRFLAREFRVSLYIWTPAAFLIGATVSVLVYRFLIERLKLAGRSIVQITLVVIGLEILTSALNSIGSSWYYQGPAVYTYSFGLMHGLMPRDFQLLGLPGAFIVSGVLFVITLIGTVYVLPRTRFGLALKSMEENPELSEVQGVNLGKVRAWSWFLAGGLAILVGAIYPLMFQSNLGSSHRIWISGITGCFLGGVMSPKHAFAGGFLMGFGEINGNMVDTGTHRGVDRGVSANASNYRPLSCDAFRTRGGTEPRKKRQLNARLWMEYVALSQDMLLFPQQFLQDQHQNYPANQECVRA